MANYIQKPTLCKIFHFYLYNNSYDLDKINVTRKHGNGYPSENNQNGTDTIDNDGNSKYSWIPGIMLPASICVFLCVCASVCLRNGTCHWKSWMK